MNPRSLKMCQSPYWSNFRHEVVMGAVQTVPVFLPMDLA